MSNRLNIELSESELFVATYALAHIPKISMGELLIYGKPYGDVTERSPMDLFQRLSSEWDEWVKNTLKLSQD